MQVPANLLLLVTLLNKPSIFKVLIQDVKLSAGVENLTNI